jgi:hypothetical protein
MPRQEQQPAAVTRKRPAVGLHAELSSLEAVSHWDLQKQRNLASFFHKFVDNKGTAGNAAKRHRPEWSAVPPSSEVAFNVGHNKPRPAVANGGISTGVRATSPQPW